MEVWTAWSPNDVTTLKPGWQYLHPYCSIKLTWHHPDYCPIKLTKQGVTFFNGGQEKFWALIPNKAISFERVLRVYGGLRIPILNVLPEGWSKHYLYNNITSNWAADILCISRVLRLRRNTHWHKDVSFDSLLSRAGLVGHLGERVDCSWHHH